MHACAQGVRRSQRLAAAARLGSICRGRPNSSASTGDHPPISRHTRRRAEQLRLPRTGTSSRTRTAHPHQYQQQQPRARRDSTSRTSTHGQALGQLSLREAHHRVLRVEVRLPEVVDVAHVRAPSTCQQTARGSLEAAAPLQGEASLSLRITPHAASLYNGARPPAPWGPRATVE